jgi:hypothetical protein
LPRNLVSDFAENARHLEGDVEGTVDDNVGFHNGIFFREEW